MACVLLSSSQTHVQISGDTSCQQVPKHNSCRCNSPAPKLLCGAWSQSGLGFMVLWSHPSRISSKFVMVEIWPDSEWVRGRGSQSGEGDELAFQYFPFYWGKIFISIDLCFYPAGMDRYCSQQSLQRNQFDFSASDKERDEQDSGSFLEFRRCSVLLSLHSARKPKSSWECKDLLTSHQIREMTKVSSWLHNCLLKEQPVCTPYFI